MARLRLHRRQLVVVGSALLAVVVAVVVYLLVRDDSAGGDKLQTATAQRGALTETVDASFTFQFASTSTLSAPTSAATSSSSSRTTSQGSGGAGGVVTAVPLVAGQQLNGIVQLFALNNTLVYGIPSSAPFYRDLVSGDQGDDIHALQQALTAAGYDTQQDTDGTFGSRTLNALERFQVDNGLPETGSLSLSQFVSYPPGSTVIDVKAAVGQTLQSGATVADLGVGPMVANALVSQTDFPNVKLGQLATLAIDSAPGTDVPGAVFGLGTQAATQTQAAGSSSPVQLGVTVAPTAPLPPDTRAGMTGQAHIDIVNRQNVVIVPTSAVRGTGNSPTVQVVSNGKQQTRPVVTGLTTGSQTEIVTGLQPGEVVVTGTIAPAQTATTTTSGLGGERGGTGGFGGGGGRGGGGTGSQGGGGGGLGR
jgi:macrolide-specific efflux system membrane fusion protein